MDLELHPTVPAEEAARITLLYVGMDTHIEIGQYYGQIQDDLLAKGHTPQLWGSLWIPLILTTLWNAGRIQGIRSERARRRTQPAPPATANRELQDPIPLLDNATPYQSRTIRAFAYGLLKP